MLNKSTGTNWKYKFILCLLLLFCILHQTVYLKQIAPKSSAYNQSVQQTFYISAGHSWEKPIFGAACNKSV